MPSLEKYIQNASQSAQEVVNHWSQQHHAGNSSLLTEEFKTVFNLASNFLEAERHRKEWEELSENEHLKGKLETEVAAAKLKEEQTKRAFAEALKTAEERLRPVSTA